MLTTPIQGQVQNPLKNEHPVKLTAIVYLKEALAHERYEECAGMITIAREFGASSQELAEILKRASEYRSEKRKLTADSSAERRKRRRFV